jgi:DNA-binding NarL/FixJ family response regulator
VRDGRDGGAITSAIEALFLLSNDAYFSGQWKELPELVDEGLALCEFHNYGLLAWHGRFLQGLLAASRGEQATASAVADDMTSWAAPRKVGCVMGYAAHIRTLAALGSGDYDAAYRHATGVAAAGEIPRYVPGALWMILDVVEAAVRSGHLAEARAHVAAAHELRLGDISPRLALVCAGAAAMCAPNDAVHQFDTALALAGADRWPFERARIELAYGEHLRRTKATTEARQHLTAAFETFQRLDTPAWTNRAASELRASGLATRKPEPGGATSLSPQQREIALLAATGLTNKQIGERLYLSPRTVATHLYQLFPKLGVTSRAALRDALAAETAPAQNDSRPVK